MAAGKLLGGEAVQPHGKISKAVGVCSKYLLLLAVLAAGLSAETLKPKVFVLESLKRLDTLVNKKKTVKPPFTLGAMFDGFADDTKELLEVLDKQGPANQPNNDQKQAIKMIMHNMAVMQKLLIFMNSGAREPLQDYCRSQSDDPIWGTICNRPAKRILRPDLSSNEKTPRKTYTHPDDEIMPIGNR